MNISNSYPIKWGVIGTGKISEDFCTAIMCLGRTNHTIEAVASRTLDSGKKFASKFRIKTYYDNYVDLYCNPNVDIVYIGTVTSTHYECSLRALQHGKPVLCEKPLCITVNQCKHILESAKSKNVLLIEGLWTRFLPTYEILREELVNKTIGEISFLEIKFGLKFDWKSTVQITKKNLGGGTTLGLGCYALHLAGLVFNSEKPVDIFASGKLNNGLDEAAEIKLSYSGDRSALISLSTVCDYENNAVINGTKGSIILVDFWCCEKIVVCNNTFVRKIPDYGIKTNYPKTIGFTYEIEQAGKSYVQKEIEVNQVKHNDSLVVAEILNEILRQLGVSYEDTCT